MKAVLLSLLFISHANASITSIQYPGGAELIQQTEAGLKFIDDPINSAPAPVGICAVDLDHPSMKDENPKRLAKHLARFSGMMIYRNVLSPLTKIVFSKGKLESLDSNVQDIYTTPYGLTFFMAGTQAVFTDGGVYALGERVDLKSNGDGSSSVKFRYGRESFRAESVTKERSQLPLKCVAKNFAPAVEEASMDVVTQPIEDETTGEIAYLACASDHCNALRTVYLNPVTKNAYWIGKLHQLPTSNSDEGVNSHDIRKVSRSIYKNTVVAKDRLSRYSYYQASKWRLALIQTNITPLDAVNHLSRGQNGWNWSTNTLKVSHQDFFNFMMGSALEKETFKRFKQQQRHPHQRAQKQQVRRRDR